MERVLRSSKLLVVADEAGNIVSAAWPGVQSEGAPPQTGVVLSDGRVAHEVDLPDELYEAARPDLSGYRLRIYASGEAVLEKYAGT